MRRQDAIRVLLQDFWTEAKVGGVVRVITPTSIRTLVAFGEEGSVCVRFEQFTEFDGAIEQWKHLAMYSDSSTPTMEAVRRENSVTVGGKKRPDLQETIPSYATHLLLERMLRQNSAKLVFRELIESENPKSVEAELVRRGREEVTTPMGVIAGDRIELLRDGVLANTYWCDDESALVIDWNGALSYRVKTIPSLLDGLDLEPASWIERFSERYGV